MTTTQQLAVLALAAVVVGCSPAEGELVEIVDAAHAPHRVI